MGCGVILGGGVGEVGFGCGFLFGFFCCGCCSLGFGLGFLGGGGCFFVFCFLRKMLAKFTTTTLNGLGRIRTNTGVSIWDSHLRFPFQSGKKNRHSQSMSHLILASTISKTGQTNHDLKAPMPLPYQVSQLARAQRHQCCGNVMLNDMNPALCDWNTVQGMTITQVFFTQSSSCTVHLLVQISQSRLLKHQVNNGYVCQPD